MMKRFVMYFTVNAETNREKQPLRTTTTKMKL